MVVGCDHRQWACRRLGADGAQGQLATESRTVVVHRGRPVHDVRAGGDGGVDG